MLRAPSIIGSRQPIQTASPEPAAPAAATSRSSDVAARVSTRPFWIDIWACCAPSVAPSRPTVTMKASLPVMARLPRGWRLLDELQEVIRGRLRVRRHLGDATDDRQLHVFV